MTLPKEKKIAHLEKILESDIFRNKTVYQKLLRYLLDVSFEGEAPKETTVAQDVFHKGTEFNSSEDATVRVHMHNLRNKLDQYYENQGAGESIRLYIPKGHYRMEFRESVPVKNVTSRAKNKISVIGLSILVVLLLLYIVVDNLVLDVRTDPAEFTRGNNTLWANFFNNGFPTDLIVGDFLVFHEWNEELKRSRRIMDYEINTADELETYIADHPELYAHSWDLGELPHNIIYNIIDIEPVFRSFHQNINIRFSSEIDINAIKSKNLIYIGEFKNLRALLDLARGLPIKFETLPWWHGIISYTQNDSLVTLKTSRDWETSRYVTDLGILAKLPGIADENYLLCAGFGYNSQIKIVEMISQIESLRSLEAEMVRLHGSIPDYFVMVFEVKGFDRASTTADLKYFSPLDKNEYLQGLVP